MFLFKRIAPVVTALVIIFTGEIWLRRPEFVWWVFLVSLVLTVLLTYLVTYKKLTLRPSARYLLVILLIDLAGKSMLLFVVNDLVKQLIIVLTGILAYFYLENLFTYLHLPERYRAYVLENLNVLAAVYVFLMLTTSFFAFMVFMNWSLLLCLFLLLVLCVLCLMIVFRASKIDIKVFHRHLFVDSLIILELFIVLAYFSFSFYLKGVLLLSVFYTLSGMSKLKMTDNANLKNLSKYIFIVIAVVIVSFLTARWT